MNRFTSMASLAALAIALLALPAAAQDAPAPDANADPSADRDIVVTAQARNRSEVLRQGSIGVLGDKDAADVPFSIRSFNETLVLNQQPQTLGQLLENDPTIRTTLSFGNTAELFVIRGFPLFSDDIALDGLYGVTPRQLVAPELYAQVQVINGASAFLNGAAPGGSALGGSINLIPKRAGATPLTRVTANYTSDGQFGGSGDVSRRFGADGRFGVRVNGGYRAGDVSVDGEFRRNAVVGGDLDYDAGALHLSLDIAYQRVEVRRLRHKVTLAAGLTAIPRPPESDHNFAQDYTYTTLRDVFGTFKADWQVAPNATLYLNAGARDGSERGIYGGLTVTNAATGDGTGTALFVPRTDNNEAVTGGLRVKLAANGITNEFNVGGSYVWQVNRNAFDFLYGPNFAGFPTNIYDTPQRAPLASAFVGGDLDDPYPVSRTRLGSAFASVTLGLFDDRVLITGGLRLQGINVKSYDYGDGVGAQTGEYSESAVTPVVGLVVKPAEGVSLFANRIEALQQGPVAPAGTINAGQTFAPFKTTQYEVGGKLTRGRFNASLAAFTTTLPVAVSTPVAGSTLFRFALDGEQRNRGVEFTVDGQLARGLRVIAGATVLDAKLRRTQGGVNDGNDAQGIPDVLANANVEYDLPFLRGLTLTSRVVYTGEQAVNNANTLRLPDWTRVDVGARFVAAVADRPVTFRLNVDNVANNRYWASAFDSFSQALLQGLPRTYKGSVTVDF